MMDLLNEYLFLLCFHVTLADVEDDTEQFALLLAGHHPHLVEIVPAVTRKLEFEYLRLTGLHGEIHMLQPLGNHLSGQIAVSLYRVVEHLALDLPVWLQDAPALSRSPLEQRAIHRYSEHVVWNPLDQGLVLSLALPQFLL